MQFLTFIKKLSPALKLFHFQFLILSESDAAQPLCDKMLSLALSNNLLEDAGFIIKFSPSTNPQPIFEALSNKAGQQIHELENKRRKFENSLDTKQLTEVILQLAKVASAYGMHFQVIKYCHQLFQVDSKQHFIPRNEYFTLWAYHCWLRLDFQQLSFVVQNLNQQLCKDINFLLLCDLCNFVAKSKSTDFFILRYSGNLAEALLFNQVISMRSLSFLIALQSVAYGDTNVLSLKWPFSTQIQMLFRTHHYNTFQKRIESQILNASSFDPIIALSLPRLIENIQKRQLRRLLANFIIIPLNEVEHSLNISKSQIVEQSKKNRPQRFLLNEISSTIEFVMPINPKASIIVENFKTAQKLYQASVARALSSRSS